MTGDFVDPHQAPDVRSLSVQGAFNMKPLLARGSSNVYKNQDLFKAAKYLSIISPA